MSEKGVPKAKLLRCLSCGAPVVARSGDTVVECKYCGSNMTVATAQAPSSTVIIVETRHRHARRRRFHRLFESADFTSNEVETPPEGEHGEK